MSKRKNNRAIGKQSSRLHQTINGLVLASVLVVSPSAMADVDASAKRNYHISSGSLSSALSQFAGSAGILLSVDARMTDGKSSKGLDGEYTVEQGLQKLLAGSGLVHAFNGNTVTLKVVEKLDAETLSEVTVTEKSELSKYQVDRSTAGSKIPLEITRIPQGIQVVTYEAIKDQGVASIGDILKKVSSATIIGSRLSRFPKVSIRGFKADQTRNGIRQIFGGDGDWSALSHIQSVEVLKGPGSTVSGQQNTDGGGVINIVTKRAMDKFASEFSFTQGGYDGFDGNLTSGAWDVNAPVLLDGDLKIRFTGEIEGSKSFVNYQNLNRENFGLAMTWDNGGPVRGYINAEYANRRSIPNPGLPILGTIKGSGLANIAHTTYLGEPNLDNLEAETPLVQGWVEFDIAKDWKITPRFQFDQFNIDQNQIFMGGANLNSINKSINVARTGRTGFQERDTNYIGQIDITGKIKTGFLEHQLFLGGDYTAGDFSTKSNNLIGVPSINALNPYYLSSPLSVNPTLVGSYGTTELGSFAFQDVISITPKFDLMGGVRYSSYQATRFIRPTNVMVKQNTDNTSYQIGGTFHATDSIHLFAGYGEGFSPTPAINGLAGGKMFEPGLTEQIETGIKINFVEGVQGTASYFETIRTNVTTPDKFNPGYSVQTGEIKARGVEFDLSYKITDNWHIQGGYAFIDAKITKSNDATLGNEPEKTPEHQSNIWTHYEFDDGILKNLTLSGGANYVGNRPYDNANSAELPNFTTVDLGVSYPYKNAKFELFANNVLDKRYFVSADYGPAVFSGDPRTIFGRVSLKF